MFFVKIDSKGQKQIHSICRNTNTCKFVFPQSLRDPKKHLDGVQKKVMSTSFKSKSHVPYQLKGKEIRFYIDVTNGEFWYNKIKLMKFPVVDRRQASDDVISSENESEDEGPIIIEDLDQDYKWIDTYNKRKASERTFVKKPKIKKSQFVDPIESNYEQQLLLDNQSVNKRTQASITKSEQLNKRSAFQPKFPRQTATEGKQFEFENINLFSFVLTTYNSFLCLQ